jgi:YesN/AraC family two-component response regulator
MKMADKKKTLLIVDDSLIIRQAIARFMESFDIEIIATAHNGETALELYKDKGTGLKALKMGASSYLTKPFGAQKFKSVFERFLEDA